MIHGTLFPLVKKFEQNKQELLRRYNLEAQSVTMHPRTFDNLRCAYPLDVMDSSYAANYFRGVKVLQSTDVPEGSFYFSHQL